MDDTPLYKNTIFIGLLARECLMQKDLAEAINLTENTICRVKKGLPIRCKSAKKIADYFNYEIHDLFPLLFINGAVQETRVYQRLKREAQMN